MADYTSEINWRPETRTNTLVGQHPNGTVIHAFWLDDRDGLFGEGYGYIATIPGTRRGVSGTGRLATLDDVVRDAIERVSRAMKRPRPGADHAREQARGRQLDLLGVTTDATPTVTEEPTL